MTTKRALLFGLLLGLLLCQPACLGIASGGPDDPVDAAEPLPDAGTSPDLRCDSSPPAPFVIVSIKADPPQLNPGDNVNLTVEIRNSGTTQLEGGHISIEAKSPDGRQFVQEVTDLSIAPSAAVPVTQERGPYTIVGSWVFSPALHGAADEVLATAEGVTVQVGAPPDPQTGLTNPLNGIAAYGQINTDSYYGSCGSHSGAVAIAYLKGLRNDNDATTEIERAIYKSITYSPGENVLKSGYDAYMRANSIPYKSLSIGADSVLSRVKAGSPVVAHLTNHYVCIFGLAQEGDTWYVYFSDGVHGYGSSGSWGIGEDGLLRKMEWSAFRGKLAGGFISFDKA